MFRQSEYIRESHYEHGLSAGLASFMGQIISYPLDVLKRRMMVLDEKEKVGISRMLRRIYHENGFFRGFYKGVSINLLKAPLANVISFASRDIFNKNFIKK